MERKSDKRRLCANKGILLLLQCLPQVAMDAHQYILLRYIHHSGQLIHMAHPADIPFPIIAIEQIRAIFLHDPAAVEVGVGEAVEVF